MPNNLYDTVIGAIKNSNIDILRTALNQNPGSEIIMAAVSVAVSKYTESEASGEASSKAVLRELFSHKNTKSAAALMAGKDEMFDVVRKALETADHSFVEFVCWHGGFDPSYAPENRSSPILYTLAELKESKPEGAESASQRHQDLHKCLQRLIAKDDEYREVSEISNIAEAALPRCCPTIHTRSPAAGASR